MYPRALLCHPDDCLSMRRLPKNIFRHWGLTLRSISDSQPIETPPLSLQALAIHSILDVSFPLRKLLMFPLDVTLYVDLLFATLGTVRTLEHGLLTTFVELMSAQMLFLTVGLAAECAAIGCFSRPPPPSTDQGPPFTDKAPPTRHLQLGILQPVPVCNKNTLVKNKGGLPA